MDESSYWQYKSGIDIQSQSYQLPLLVGAKLSKDGDQWCCLLGDNLQDGIAGFGKSPADACQNLWTAFHTPA